MIILKFIGLYFLLELLTGVGVCLEVGASLILTWLHSFKGDRIMPFYSYYSIYLEAIKDIIRQDENKYNKLMCIPFVNMISIINTIRKGYNKCLESPEYMKETHIISGLEREKIEEIKGDNKLNIVGQVKDLFDFVMSPLDIDSLLSKISDGNYYKLAEKYNYDESCYVAYGTKMRPTFGQINGKTYAIFDALDLESIREKFPAFNPIDPDNLTGEEIKMIFLRRPDEADICYMITHLLYNRSFRKMEIIESKTNNNEPANAIVKLTK